MSDNTISMKRKRWSSETLKEAIISQSSLATLEIIYGSTECSDSRSIKLPKLDVDDAEDYGPVNGTRQDGLEGHQTLSELKQPRVLSQKRTWTTSAENDAADIAPGPDHSPSHYRFPRLEP
ncbi:hypothetical protein BGX23_009075 [Mortierella sp. AD031]|nr:hypothetical protein BGX23_009075 [Mortierella sp. AD031]